MTTDSGESSDTMRGRAAGDTRLLWFLLDADRWIVTAFLSGVLFFGVLAAGHLHPTPAMTLLTRGDPVETLFQALITGTITAVTLVLTLNQLVLSQELGAVGDQRERMDGSMQFRADVADAIDTPVSPAEPSAFLRSLVRGTAERAENAQNAAEGAALDDDLSALLSNYLADVTSNADRVTDQLDGGTFGEFDVVKAALNYNYSWKLYAGRRIREAYADELTDEVDDSLAELVETLELFGPAREHFKTLYFQWELSDLSRTLLYVAIPALTVAITSLLFLDVQDFVGVTAGVSDALWLLAVTVTGSLLPFTVLISYVLRIVTITKRTLAIGPFILRETNRSVDVDWE
ncbi:hypothetical protein [Haloarcula argentinensis]|uniref:Uncharacterized protein n=1 Tax=Haloarcula argentinensis TaxID=43776 RepID=A0ABU2EXG4_HALAR|nr:hypothetical protein [Haloarcula argentinensis]EMA22170.1 hypothetical protein C443_09447 [Haloarcula argentinensis DSM 12282]MDS0252520.1 hypothetical protein [Haloarcula argentinensis]